MILSKSGSPNVWVVQRGRHGFETADDAARRIRRRAGRRTDNGFVSRQKSPSAACSQKFPQAAAQFSAFRRVGAPNPTEPDWSPDGKWIAFTCADAAASLTSASCRRTAGDAGGAGAGRRPVVVAEFADAGFHAARGRALSCCLCLTCSRNKSRILAGFRGTILNPPGRNNFGALI